jgi:alkylation response protein AidB-like acyl-CoA dehydrogenase
LRTTAVREGDHYVVNGQKLWTSTAHHAEWCFLLVRTDPAAKKQQGISYLLMEMQSPGVTIRPIVTIDGHHETNEMFLDNVRVPVNQLVGEENKGWDCAKYLLGHERSGIARVGVSKMRIRRARQLAAHVMCEGRPLIEDERFLESVALIEVELKALEITQMRLISEIGKRDDNKPDPKSSILKIKGSQLQQATAQLLMEVGGYPAMEFDAAFVSGLHSDAEGDEWALTLSPNHFWARHVSIVGGSNEIQRNILAKTVLGL